MMIQRNNNDGGREENIRSFYFLFCFVTDWISKEPLKPFILFQNLNLKLLKTEIFRNFALILMFNFLAICIRTKF